MIPMVNWRRSCVPLIVALAWVTAGCSFLTSRQAQSGLNSSKECLELFSRLDRHVWKAGVRDASLASIHGFPYLRCDRFLAALGGRVLSEAESEQWVDLMRRSDIQSRQKEVRNLPDEALEEILAGGAGEPGRSKLLERVSVCSEQLHAHDRSRPEYLRVLRDRTRVPDEYSLGMRVAGLHPLASVPVAVVTLRVRDRVREWFQGDMSGLPVRGMLQRFAPEASTNLRPSLMAEWIDSAAQNPLAVPLLSAEQGIGILEHYAPEFFVDVAGPYDRPGSVSRAPSGPLVDADRPTVYAYLSHGFLRGKPILQCNYVIWFSERAGEASPRIERGRLDGLTVRISLGFQGKPFMVDIMNNCGCYHFFVPDPSAVALPKPRPAALDPFVPQWLPAVAPGQRLGIRVGSGWHQVERVYPASVEREPGPATPYRLAPYEELESHRAVGGDRSMSLFDNRGIAVGSGRIEPLIFFPMGIHSVGSMRQRGRHAIDLIGREHFDNPRLFDRNFIFF
jgi:hypothetical protein